MGTTADRLAAHYWRDRADYDAGIPAQQYWAPIVAATGGSGDAQLFNDLALLDARIWSGIRPSAWQLLRDCRGAGVTVVILSNSPHAMQTVADGAPWRVDTDHVFISASMGLVKPDAAIYRAVAGRLGLDGDEIAFIDDKQVNVDGALALGWQAHLWVSDDDTRAWLLGLGVLD